MLARGDGDDLLDRSAGRGHPDHAVRKHAAVDVVASPTATLGKVRQFRDVDDDTSRGGDALERPFHGERDGESIGGEDDVLETSEVHAFDGHGLEPGKRANPQCAALSNQDATSIG